MAVDAGCRSEGRYGTSTDLGLSLCLFLRLARRLVGGFNQAERPQCDLYESVDRCLIGATVRPLFSFLLAKERAVSM
jgi:hypothetical protein